MKVEDLMLLNPDASQSFTNSVGNVLAESASSEAHLSMPAHRHQELHPLPCVDCIRRDHVQCIVE